MSIAIRQIKLQSTNQETQLVGWLYMPAEQPKAVLQIIHGMAEHMGRYHDIMRELAQNGFAACGIDQLGHGRTCTDGKYGYFAPKDGWKQLLEDQHRFAHVVQKEAPGVPHIILGHSMGSFIARLFAAKHPKQLQGLVLSGTGRFGMRARLLKMMALRSAGRNGADYLDEELNDMLREHNNAKLDPLHTECDWLSRDAYSVQQYIDDPQCGFPFTAGAFVDLLKLNATANSAACFEKTPDYLPVLMLSGKEDPVGEYAKGVGQVFIQYQKAGISDIELLEYDGARHEVFNEINRAQVYKDLIYWLDRHFPA